MSRAWVPRLGLGLFALVVGYAIVSLSVGEGGPGTFAPRGVAETQRLLGGIRQDGDRLGPADAPIELELFTDLRDKRAAAFEDEVVNPVIERYVRTSRAQIALHHFDLGRTEITQAAVAAVAAGDQGRQWQFANLVLANLDRSQSQLADERFLSQIAEVTPEMEVPAWEQAFADPASRDAAKADEELAANLRLPAQPAIIAAGPGGREILTETPSLADVEAAIERVGGGAP